jgi:hypothetical protein
VDKGGTRFQSKNRYGAIRTGLRRVSNFLLLAWGSNLPTLILLSGCEESLMKLRNRDNFGDDRLKLGALVIGRETFFLSLYQLSKSGREEDSEGVGLGL